MSGDADIIGGFFAAPLGPGGLDRVGVALGVSGQPHHRRGGLCALDGGGDACQIGKAIGKAAKTAPDAAAAFARRVIEADMRYMHETGVLDDDGLMGDGEYDEDDAFEALFAEMTDGLEDDGEIGKIAQMLDAYMEARQNFMEENGLADD